MTAPADFTRSRKTWIWIVCVILFLFFFTCIGPQWVVELPIRLLIGWVFYAQSVLPKVKFNLAAIGVFVLALPIALVLAHSLARWLWTGVGNASRWRWKWTLLGFATVMLMFVAGIAATGVTHQTGWLITSPRPLVQNRFGTVIRCLQNLRQLHEMIENYKLAHDGRPPADLTELATYAKAHGAHPRLFVCPADIHANPAPSTSADWPALLAKREHHSYLYFPEGITPPERGDRLMLVEYSAHHRGDINAMTIDGGRVSYDTAQFRDWFHRLLDAQQPTPTTRESDAGTTGTRR